MARVDSKRAKALDGDERDEEQRAGALEAQDAAEPAEAQPALPVDRARGRSGSGSTEQAEEEGAGRERRPR